MSEIKIEPYSDIYQESVGNMIVSIQNSEFGVPITLDMQPDLKNIVSYYQAGDGNFWIARLEDRVIGTISLKDIGDKKGALRKMFVVNEFRGKEFGIGQKLLDHLLEWARQKGIKEIFLGTTEKFLAAQRFYEKNGFKEVEKNELPGAFPVMKVDVKFYRLLTIFNSFK